MTNPRTKPELMNDMKHSNTGPVLPTYANSVVMDLELTYIVLLTYQRAFTETVQ